MLLTLKACSPMNEHGGGEGSACAAAASADNTNGSVPLRGVGTGALADLLVRNQQSVPHVKNKQWTRRVDGLTKRDEYVDSGLHVSNWLKFSVKKASTEKVSPEEEEDPETMGNLQVGEKKSKDAGKSPVKEKKRGFLTKKPENKSKGPAPEPPVEVPVSVVGGNDAPRASQVAASQHNGTDIAPVALERPDSRDSSSESLFLDPLSSPDVDPPPPQMSSPGSRTTSTVSHPPDDSSSLEDVTLIEDTDADITLASFQAGSLGIEEVDEPLTEPLPAVNDLSVSSSQRPTSFTLHKHRRVELGSVSGTLSLQNDGSRRHSSVSDAPSDSNVLRKVASLTLDKNMVEQRLSKPKCVPDKLDFQIYEKFEGQQLLNWFISSFPDDHYLKMLLTSQDLRILGSQFCTHLLAAGVLRQISDKDAPMDPLFRPDLMYFWSHSETPAITPATPGKLPSGIWTPSTEAAPVRSGAKYTEADCGTPASMEFNPMTASTTSVDRVIRKIEVEEFQQTVMGLKREHKDNLVKLTRGQEIKLFTLRGEHAQYIQEQEQQIGELSEEVQRLRQQIDKLKTISEIQELTSKAMTDFESPTSQIKPVVPSNQASPIIESPVRPTSPAKESLNGPTIVLPQNGNASHKNNILHQSVSTLKEVADSVLRTDSEEKQSPEIATSQEISSSDANNVQISTSTPGMEDASKPEEDIQNQCQNATSNVQMSSYKLQEMTKTDCEVCEVLVQEAEKPEVIGPPSTPMPGTMGPPPPPMPGTMGPPPPPMPGTIGPPPPPMPGMMGPPPPMPGMMGPPPPPMPGMMGPPPPPMPGMMGPPPPPMPGMIGPPPPPMPGMMGPPPPPMPGMMGPPPPPMPGMMGPPPPPMPGMMGPLPPPMPGMMGPPALPQQHINEVTSSLGPAFPSLTPVPPAPFPTPPVGGWNAQRAVLRKAPVTPAVPMKPLYWSRIIVPVVEPAPVSPSESAIVPLWQQIEEAPIEDLTELNKLFSRQITVKKTTKAKPKEPAKAVTAKILDGKRSQNVGILASSLHVDFTEIENAVYHFDTSVVSLEALHQIYEVRATSEELSLIKAHIAANPEIPLDKPEQFLLDLSEIPNFAERIACFMFQTEYEDIINSIDSKLNNIKSVCDTLCGDGIKTVMATILAVGNYMNGGNMARGQADGFGLEILPKLRDVKSTDSSVTLLHYIVRTVIRSKDEPNVPLPLPEPGDISRAAAVDAVEIAAELTRLEEDLQVCEKKTIDVIEASSEEHLQPFKEKMEAFITSARCRIKSQRDNLDECKFRFITTSKFYQFKPKSADEAVSEFFGIWAPFAKDFKDIWKKEQQRIIKEKMQEIKKLQEDRKEGIKPVKAGGLKDKMRQRLNKTTS